MADEAVELEEGEGGGKGNLVKIIGLVVGILLLVALTIGGTLFLSGFFEADEEATAEAAARPRTGLGRALRGARPLRRRGPLPERHQHPDGGGRREV